MIIRKADGDDKVYGDLGPYPIKDGSILVIGGPEAKAFDTLADAYANEPGASGSFMPTDAAAIWIDKNTLVSTARRNLVSTGFARLYTGADADTITGRDADGNLDGQYINLTAGSLTSDEASAYPEFAAGVESGEFMVWNIPDEDLDRAKGWLRKDLEFAGINEGNLLTQFSNVQPAGAIDAFYGKQAYQNYSGRQLGAVAENGQVTFRLWAPTAQNVSVVLYGSDHQSAQKEIPLTVDDTGMWSVSTADAKPNETYYKFKVRLFRPDDNKITEYEVTDPYSLALSTNSQYSLVADLSSKDTKPAGWNDDYGTDSWPQKQNSGPALANMAITEAHIRDLSVGKDKGVEDKYQGKYLFLSGDRAAASEIYGHLVDLAEAGMTHIEILPFFDFATVNEKTDENVDLTTTCDVAKTKISVECTENTVGEQLAKLAREDVEKNDPSADDGHKVNDFLGALKDKDCYNWGYDPWHYAVPEGSYSMNHNVRGN